MTLAVLERAAARNLLDYVAAFQAAAPWVEAAAMDCAGGTAAYAGPDSPLTTIKGAGPSVSGSDIEVAEDFLRGRGAARAVWELAEWVDVASLDRLAKHGYRAVGSEDVMVRSPAAGWAPAGPAVLPMDVEAWAALMARAFELPATRAWLDMARAAAYLDGACNLGAWDDALGWMATAQMAPAGEIAIFGGDGTLPAARGRGAQPALIHERLARAARLGFATVAAETAPGGVSERNYLRAGFHVGARRVHYARDLG